MQTVYKTTLRQEHVKLFKVIKLRKLRRNFILSNLGLFIICSILTVEFHLYFFFVIFPIYAYFSLSYFLTKNSCPHCGNTFFLFTTKGFIGQSLHIYFGQNCINCDYPKKHNTTVI